MKFYWLEYSTKDHPWKYSVIFYVWWCNFNCYWCSNTKLSQLDFKKYYKEITKEEIETAIKYSPVDMIILCWGEMLVYSTDEIIKEIEYLRALKKNILIRIDTNGSFYKKMVELYNYVDWFWVDIKWPYWNYEYFNEIKKICPYKNKTKYKKNNYKDIVLSLKLADKKEYTIFRTVKYPICSEKYFLEIKTWAKKNLKRPHQFNNFVNY